MCLREGGHFRSLQQVAPPVLHSPIGELPPFASATVWSDSLSSSSVAEVRESGEVN